MDILKHKIELLGQNFFFFAPAGDDCFPGTLAGMNKNDWKLDKIDFKSGDAFVDIGCNIGLISLFVARLFPYVQVYSFDPNPVAIQCLKLAMVENNLDNIKPYHLAIGEEDKYDVEFVTYSENETCTVEKTISNLREIKYLSNMLSFGTMFDNLIEEDEIKYLKCDIEGGEFKLFDYIKEFRPDIFKNIEYLHIEIHPFDDSNPPTKKLKDLVTKQFGNKVFF